MDTKCECSIHSITDYTVTLNGCHTQMQLVFYYLKPLSVKFIWGSTPFKNNVCET